MFQYFFFYTSSWRKEKKNFAGIKFRESGKSVRIRGIKFREFDQNSRKSRNLIPAKFNTFKVLQQYNIRRTSIVQIEVRKQSRSFIVHAIHLC